MFWTFLIAAAAAAPAASPAGEANTALRTAATRIEADYVDPARGAAVARRLRAALPGISARRLSGDALADEVTRLLRTASGDQHFRLGYAAAAPAPGGGQPAADAGRANNFGVVKAERLPGNIGLIDFDNFASPDRLGPPLAAAMEFLRNCDAMILDLRFSGGGQARGGALIASYFLPAQPDQVIVQLRGRDPAQRLEIRTQAALPGARFTDRPLYILVGPETFSAAEMLAAALQEAGRARLVGARTRGGGNPVARVRLTDHYQMLLPTTRSMTAAGASWEGVGVRPDIAVAAGDAPTAARRAALTALLQARPDDLLADSWRRALQQLGPATTSGGAS